MSLKESLITRIRHRFHFFPKVSVIIPIYNAESTLRRCLDSVLWGTHIPIELVCVNDGSNDNSLQILHNMRLQYGCLRIVNISSNQGLYNARLAGIKYARGKYVGFVDSDDYVMPGYFDKLYLCARDENADIAVGKIVNQNADGVRYVQSRCETFPYVKNAYGKSVYQLYWEQAGQCYHWHVVWNKIYCRELWTKQMTVLKQMNTHLTMLEDFIYSSVVLSNVHTYVVDDKAVYNYVESVTASTHDYSGKNLVKKKILDMDRAFSFVERFLQSDSVFSEYMPKLMEWRERYGRYWKRNILQSKLTKIEKQNCLRWLEEMVGNEIGDIEESDEYYYQKADFL